MSNVTVVEKHNTLKSGSSVRIKGYLPEDDNLGLTRYHLVMFEGVVHEEPIACLEKHGVMRYVTGLNESAPEILNIADDSVRKAKAQAIRDLTADLEFKLNSNRVDPSAKNKDFWNEIKLLNPANKSFWDKIFIRITNKGLYLDMSDPHDMIKYTAIKAGGFSTVAPSLKDALKMDVPPKFYLDEAGESASTEVALSKLKNKALSTLDNLANTNQSKLMLIAKVVDGNSTQYRKSTPTDIIYRNMDEFINGKGVEKSIKRAATKFLEIADLELGVVKVKALIKDGTFYNELTTRGNGIIMHMKSGSNLGKNVNEVLENLMSPINEEVVAALQKDVEKYWNI